MFRFVFLYKKVNIKTGKCNVAKQIKDVGFL